MKYMLMLIFLSSTAQAQNADKILARFNGFYAAWNRHDFLSDDYKGFLNDTTWVWHGKKTGPGIRSVYNPFSSWKQWDVIMNGQYRVDSTIYVASENKIVSRFNETTDFLKAIGMSEGISATVHYWLDENLRVIEILYQWDPDNPDFAAHMQPIVEWSLDYDSLEIADLYLKNGFQPSWINGIRWNRILKAYSQDD